MRIKSPTFAAAHHNGGGGRSICSHQVRIMPIDRDEWDVSARSTARNRLAPAFAHRNQSVVKMALVRGSRSAPKSLELSGIGSRVDGLRSMPASCADASVRSGAATASDSWFGAGSGCGQNQEKSLANITAWFRTYVDSSCGPTSHTLIARWRAPKAAFATSS